MLIRFKNEKMKFMILSMQRYIERSKLRGETICWKNGRLIAASLKMSKRLIVINLLTPDQLIVVICAGSYSGHE